MPKPFFQGTAMLPDRKQSGKSLQQEGQGRGRDPFAQPLLPQSMKSCGIPWGKSSSQPFRNQSTNRALQHFCGKHRAGPFSHHFCALSPGFLIYLVGLPETSLWDIPVRLCWLQQLAQNSLPCIGFRRLGGTCPKLWGFCHSEHLHLHHFWSLRKGQGQQREQEPSCMEEIHT